MKKKVKILVGLFIWLWYSGNAVAENPVDNAIYASLLKQHVSHSKVDYDGFKQDEYLLDKYLDILSRTDTGDLSEKHLFAFYINAYNAFTIKLVLTKYPGINSIKEIGGFFSNPWSKKFIPLKGKTVSLDYIEHDILRPVYKDPRIHFAINCAARSCPPLMAEAYTGALLDQQLDKMTRNFINDGQSNYLDGNTLHVSRIFKWFGEDFDNDIAGYVRTYATGDFATQLQEAGDSLNVKYLDYDWSLNSK